MYTVDAKIIIMCIRSNTSQKIICSDKTTLFQNSPNFVHSSQYQIIVNNFSK